MPDAGERDRALHAAPPLFTRPFVLAALSHLCLALSGFLFLHFPGYLVELGAGEAEVGRIMALNALAAMLAAPFVGQAIDRHGRRNAVLLGAALSAAACLLYLGVTSLGPLVYAVRLLDGVAGAMLYAGLFTLGADHVPEARRTEGLAIFGASGLVPIALGAQLGDAILALADYRLLFISAGGFAVLGFLLCLRVDEVPRASDGEPARGALETARQRDLLPVWFAALAFFVSMSAAFTFLKTYVMSTGLGSVGNFFTVYAGIALALRLFAGWLPDRVGPRRMLAPALMSYALGFAVLAQATSAPIVLLAALLCGAGHGYAYPVLLSLVVKRARGSERGAAMAFYTTIDWIGMLLGPLALGPAIERAGYAATYLGVSLLLCAGIAGFHALDRR